MATRGTKMTLAGDQTYYYPNLMTLNEDDMLPCLTKSFNIHGVASTRLQNVITRDSTAISKEMDSKNILISKYNVGQIYLS